VGLAASTEVRTHLAGSGLVGAAGSGSAGVIYALASGVVEIGLDADIKRWIRMPFQPVLVLWALWSTGAWRAWRAYRCNEGRNLGVAGPKPGGSHDA
jgi:hypothetical protein